MASGNRTDISLDDPNFWQKWAKIAELDTEANNEKVELICFAWVDCMGPCLHGTGHSLLLSLDSYVKCFC